MRLTALCLLCATSLLAGCTTTGPIDVTRFHAADVPQTTGIAIAPGEGIDGGSIEYRTYAGAVSQALTKAGFSVGTGPTAGLVALVDYEVGINRPLDARGSPVSVGIGGGGGSFGSGVGVGLGINLSGPPKAQILNRLAVRIVRGRGGPAVWEGRAQTSAREGSAAAQPGNAAVRLADALFRDYPGRSGETITVR